MARRRTMLGPAKPLAETGCRVRRSRVVLTPRSRRQVCGGVRAQPGFDAPYSQMTVTNKPDHRGEREVSRKTIARGMPGETGVTVVTTLVCFVLFRTRGCGCIERPAFPAPSIGRKFQAHLGRIAP